MTKYNLRYIVHFRLKVNDHKCSFRLKEIPYLVYVITREGMNPDPNKVQSIMDLGRPTTTTETQAFISVVHYYMDLWPRRSHILAPLTEIDIGTQGRKMPWNG